MEPEPALVRVERGQRRGAAHVRDPRARLDLPSHLGDRAVGHAEEDELGAVVEHADAPLAQPGGDRGADAARADDLDRFERRKLQFLSGYRAGTV
jgi:hypothetical protein